MVHAKTDVDKNDFMLGLAYTLGCFILPKYMIKSFANDDKELVRELLDKIKGADEDDEPEELEQNLSNDDGDFFGYLEGMDIEEKKSSVLETYKLIFRFSIEKLINYIKDNTFIIIIM